MDSAHLAEVGYRGLEKFQKMKTSMRGPLQKYSHLDMRIIHGQSLLEGWWMKEMQGL